MGAWFPKDKGGIFKPLSQWGKAKCQREDPSNCQLPILSFVPNHLFLPEIGWGSYCIGMGRVWTNSNWAEHPFWKNMFWLNRQVRTQKFITHPLCIHILSSSCISGALGVFPHALTCKQAGIFLHALMRLSFLTVSACCVFSLSWAVVFFNFPRMGIRFCNDQWVGFLPHYFDASPHCFPS